jgi:hypothetical protein
VRPVASIVFATLLVACGEYAHTNPYEPGANVEIAIDGPDTVASLGALVRYSVRSTPPMPDVNPVWASSFSDVLESLGSGVYRPISNRPVTISVTLGPHTGKRSVVVQQRFDRMALCLNTACNPTFLVGDPSRRFPLTPVDAARAAMASADPGPITAVSRDTGVVRVGIFGVGAFSVGVEPVRAGLTYIVVFSGGHADSMTVVVEPRR